MRNPAPPGHWRARMDGRDFRHLKPGTAYRVARAFADHDGDAHPVGEAWTFLGYDFVPYHDGLSLYVATADGQEWQVRFLWHPEGQGPIVDALADHIVPA